jgi:formamidopyrimidine-DNA glycosylase
MPELPEVETVRRRIEPRLVGRRIEEVVFRPRTRLLRDTLPGRAVARHLRGARVEAINRRGKYLIWKLDCGHALVLHLGMTGKLIDVAPGREEPHTHARFRFRGFDLLFTDARTFGRIVLLPQGKVEALPGLAAMGPEPLGRGFSVAYIQECLQGRRAPIKALLLDQRVVAGLGNIYVDEALFRAGISPLRKAGSLQPRELAQLRQAIRRVLLEAIRLCGTTIMNFQWDRGREGGFQKRLRVYGRQGQPCRSCRQPLVSARIAGRTTTFCPRCQPRRPR